jgi:DNA-binding NarL/FixJ family response regulator
MSNNSELLEKTNALSGSDRDMDSCLSQRTSLLIENLNLDSVLEEQLAGPEFDVTLTKREREILEFVLAGKTNKEIAQELYRTERTVEYHRNRMMRKLGTHTTVELVKCAIAMGIA